MRYADIIHEDAESNVRSDDLFEMANLRQQQTGVPGTIYISTAQASHGPRVKHFAGRPGAGVPYFSVSVEVEPKVVEAKGVSEQEINANSPAVIEWVRINHERLSEFWYKGTTWFDTEVTAFKRSLVKLSKRQ